MVDADLIALGLKPRDPASPIPAPEAQAEADLAFPGIHLVQLRNIRPVSSVPDARSDYGVRIWYGLSGEPTGAHRFRVAGVPKTGKDLPESLFTWRKKELFVAHVGTYLFHGYGACPRREPDSIAEAANPTAA